MEDANPVILTPAKLVPESSEASRIDNNQSSESENTGVNISPPKCDEMLTEICPRKESAVAVSSVTNLSSKCVGDCPEDTKNDDNTEGGGESLIAVSNITQVLNSNEGTNYHEAMAVDTHTNLEIHPDNSVVASEANVTEICAQPVPIQNVSKVNKGIENSASENIGKETSEVMVTDDVSIASEVDCTNVINDSENNDVKHDFEKKRDPVIVEGMNKVQSWKTDKTYQNNLSSLKLLSGYGSDSDENDSEDAKSDKGKSSSSNLCNKPVNPCPTVHQQYRKPEEVTLSDSDESDSSEEDDEDETTSTASSSSSSNESDESGNESETAENECVVVEPKKPEVKAPKTKGELTLNDLPPIEDLHISVPESECVEIGEVLSIVDSLVVVQSTKGCPSLDLDSILFLDHGKTALGEVFDVFGRVGEACYCVRFNSKDHALQKGIKPGMPVYYAPRTEHSKFVFVADLLKMKGSDASWEHNNEPPPKFLDFSDDEEERRARRKKDKPVRVVEREETQPDAKRSNWINGSSRGAWRGGPSRPWNAFSHRGAYNSPSPIQPGASPRSGPQPLIRPSYFTNANNTQSHFHNAAAGAPPVPAVPSPWAVPPPAFRESFNVPNAPFPQPPFGHNQMPSDFGSNGVGNFGHPPFPQSSRNYMSTPPFPFNPRNSDTSNSFSQPNQNFRPNQPAPFQFNSFHYGNPNRFSSDNQGCPMRDGVFTNHNPAPPHP